MKTILALLLIQAGQTKPPPEAPPFPGKGTSADPAGSGAVSDSGPKPGVLPETASPAARLAWERLCAASLVPETDHAPVRAFELSLDVRYRGGQGGSRGSNDIQALYRFLAPNYVRVKIVEGGKEVVRGPDGDFFFDAGRKQMVALGVGREYAEDRRQLDEWACVARDFVALTDPRSMRIAGLETLAGPPACIPPPLQGRAGQLSWLRVRSPDFRLSGAGASSTVFRASLGHDPKTHWVEIALVEEDVDLPGAPALRSTARLIELRQPTASQGFFAPRRILVYSIEAGRAPPAFLVPAGMDLVVKACNLRAGFQAADFKPR